MPLIHNFKGLNGYRARVGRVVVVVVVVGLSIVMPTTKQWGKVEVGLGFGNNSNHPDKQGSVPGGFMRRGAIRINGSPTLVKYPYFTLKKNSSYKDK